MVANRASDTARTLGSDAANRLGGTRFSRQPAKIRSPTGITCNAWKPKCSWAGNANEPGGDAPACWLAGNFGSPRRIGTGTRDSGQLNLLGQLSSDGLIEMVPPQSNIDPGTAFMSGLGERVVRLSSSIVAPSSVALMSIVLLCGFSGTAMSQTTSSSALPSVTVVAPKQVTRPHRPVQQATTGAGRRRAPAAEKPAQTATRTPPPEPGSVLAKLKELERTSSNCTDGCQTSFKY